MKDKAGAAPRLLILVLSLAILSLVLSGCGSSSEEVTTYTIADEIGDWGYPSPYTHYARGPGYVRMSFVFDTLVWKDETGFVPALAEEWEYVETENAYVFQLRSSATWHDGEKFTAHDVAFTFDYCKEHPYQLVDSSIVKAAEAVNDHTVKLYLKDPYAPFLNDVAGTQPILPEHIWESVQEPETFTGPEAVVGTGPYKLVDYSREHGTYLYEAYDNYYLGRPKVDRIKFVKVVEQMVAAALEQGTVDAAPMPPEVVEDIQARGFTVLQAPYGWNAKLMINHTKEPLSSEQFRQALAYAIDREALVEITQRNQALAGSPGIMPPDSEWYNADIETYEHDPARSQQVLEELGYALENGYFTKDGKELRLELIAEATFKPEGQFIKGELESIGIKVDFSTLEGKTVDAKVLDWQFDLSIYGHGGLYEPSILNKVITGQGFNSARYQANETLNQLLATQLTEMDYEERCDLVGQIQAIYADELPALTLYYPNWYWAHDGTIDLYYTSGGIGAGVPLPLNKMALVKQ